MLCLEAFVTEAAAAISGLPRSADGSNVGLWVRSVGVLALLEVLMPLSHDLVECKLVKHVLFTLAVILVCIAPTIDELPLSGHQIIHLWHVLGLPEILKSLAHHLSGAGRSLDPNITEGHDRGVASGGPHLPASCRIAGQVVEVLGRRGSVSLTSLS